MKKKISGFSVCCVVFLFVFAAFMVWYIPSMSSLQTKITDTRQSLETSRGRENKQQDEYDKAQEEAKEAREATEAKRKEAKAAAKKAATGLHSWF